MAEHTGHPAASEEFSTKVCRRYPVRNPGEPVAPPIYMSSTWEIQNAAHGAALCNREDTKEFSPFFYTRWGNPTNDVAEQLITNLEGGHSSFVTASGMAAISTALMSFLKAGDHIVAPAASYSGAYEFIHLVKDYHIDATFVDARDVKNYENAIKPNTKVLYLETPANPVMSLADLSAVASLAKARGIVTIADNTLSTPYHTRPIEHGVDVVVHSATKYFGGHSDLLAGSITVSNAEQHERVFYRMKLFGGTLAPQAAFLLQRGIKTLNVRMERESGNALAVAQFLHAHPAVKKVNYPGLPSHPQHELAKRQMRNGFGGLISFEVYGGVDAGRTVIENVKLIILGASLGGVESLIEHPASMTHTMVAPEIRAQTGITDGLIRLSIGIENVKDLIADLTQALALVTARA